MALPQISRRLRRVGGARLGGLGACSSTVGLWVRHRDFVRNKAAKRHGDESATDHDTRQFPWLVVIGSNRVTRYAYAARTGHARMSVGPWIAPRCLRCCPAPATAVLLSDAPPLQAGLVGLCGAYYLMQRHAERTPAGSVGRSAMVAAVRFTVVAVSVASLPLDLPRLPILAAPIIFVAYVVAVRSFSYRTVLAQHSS